MKAGRDEALIGHMLIVASRVAQKMGLTNGYRTVVNEGKNGGQAIPNFSIQVIGG